jgi:hypothetical protein
MSKTHIVLYSGLGWNHRVKVGAMNWCFKILRGLYHSQALIQLCLLKVFQLCKDKQFNYWHPFTNKLNHRLKPKNSSTIGVQL